MTSAAQDTEQTAPNKSYEQGVIITWDESNTIPLDSITVDEQLHINAKLPSKEELIENEKLFDLMREKRDPEN